MMRTLVKLAAVVTLSVSPPTQVIGKDFTFTVEIVGGTPNLSGILIELLYLENSEWFLAAQTSVDTDVNGNATAVFTIPATRVGTFTLKARASYGADFQDSNQVTATVVAEVAQVSLVITAGLGGTTDPAPGTHSYDVGTIVTVKAIAENGYKFKHWLINGQLIEPYSHQNPTVGAITENSALEAVFEEGEEPKPFPWPLVVVGVTAVIIIIVVATKR
ncbi:hypothetical protein ES702_01405 [subsurface metagenome]